MRTSPLLATVPSLAARQKLLDAVRAEARRRGMTMGQLAAEAGLPPETLSRLPRRKDVGFDTLWRLASAVGFSIGLVASDGFGERLERGLFDPAQFPGFKE